MSELAMRGCIVLAWMTALFPHSIALTFHLLGDDHCSRMHLQTSESVWDNRQTHSQKQNCFVCCIVGLHGTLGMIFHLIESCSSSMMFHKQLIIQVQNKSRMSRHAFGFAFCKTATWRFLALQLRFYWLRATSSLKDHTFTLYNRIKTTDWLTNRWVSLFRARVQVNVILLTFKRNLLGLHMNLHVTWNIINIITIYPIMVNKYTEVICFTNKQCWV